ncbi:MAG: LysM peptidoglycan-binding domain-containing protein [Pseudomonadota bacterium]
MNIIRKSIILLTLLLAGGCASVDHVAEAPVASDQTAANSSHKPQSLHLVNITQEPLEEIRGFWDQLRQGFRLTGTQQAAVSKQTATYGKHPQQVERIFERGEPYLAYILSEVQKRDFPAEIALLPFVESSYDPFAFSYELAAGLWQFIPTTGKMYGLHQDWWYDGRRDVVESTQAALNYLDYLQNKFDGDWLLAVAAYNSGSGTISKAIRKNQKAGKPADFWHLDLPKETAAYVPKLLAISNIVREPEKYDISLVPVEVQPFFIVVETEGQMDISVAAELAEMNTEALYLLNPGYNRWTTHPQGPHQLVIPVSNLTTFKQNLAKLPDSERTRPVLHIIQSGETLSHIARRYSTTVQALIDNNRLSSTRIRIGQKLLIATGSHDTTQYTKLNQRIMAAYRASGKKTYRVRSGDNLWTIARRHRVTVKQVSRWNKLDTKTPIRPGQKLVIYTKG